MAKNTTIIAVSLPTVMAKKIDEMAVRQHMTRSEFARDVFRRQLFWAASELFRKELALRAQEAGIRTDEDVMRLVEEVRYGRKTKK